MRPTLSLLAFALLTACPKKTPETPVTPTDPTATTATDPTPGEPTPDEPKPGDKGDKGDKGTDTAATTTPPPGNDQLTPEERLVNDAVALLEKGDSTSRARAKEMLEGVTRKNPEMAWAWFNLGVAEYMGGDKVKARDRFETAASTDPKFGAPYLYLGVLDQEEKGREAAIATWRAGVARDPENIDVRVALIGALRDAGRIDEAISESKAALKVNSNSLPVYNNLGLIYMEKGDLDLAKFVFMKARDSVPGGESNVYLRTNLARIYFLQGEKSAALFNYQEAVKIDPNFLPALLYLAEMYQAEHNYTDMVPLLETAAKEAPENQGVQMNLGIAYRGVGKYPEAKAAYEKALQLEPSNPEPYFNLGILYGDYLKKPVTTNGKTEDVKMYDEAIESFNTYITQGGKEKELAKTYLEAVQKDQKKYMKKKEKEAADAKRKADQAAADAAEKEAIRAAEEAKKNAPPETPPAPPPDGAPDGGAPAPTPETPPTDGGTPQ